jgi:hypothetical protein
LAIALLVLVSTLLVLIAAFLVLLVLTVTILLTALLTALVVVLIWHYLAPRGQFLSGQKQLSQCFVPPFQDLFLQSLEPRAPSKIIRIELLPNGRGEHAGEKGAANS